MAGAGSSKRRIYVMATNSEVVWLTILGLSFLFIGGFVLWVYGTYSPQNVTLHSAKVTGPEAEATRKLHSHFVQWFLLYGGAAVFAGIGFLLTATMLIL
jgi:hypothetical protein